MRIGTVSLSLLLATALVLTGNGLLSTLVAVRLSDAGVAPGTSGPVLAAYFGGITVGTLLLPSTIRRVGNIRSFAAFTALGIAAALGHGFLPAGLAWAGLRFLTGLSMAGLYMTVESWLTAEAAPSLRGRVMALYLVAIYVGLALGQQLLPRVPEVGLEAFAAAGLVASVAAMVVSLTRVPDPVLSVGERLPARQLFALAPLGLAGAWVSGFVAGTIYANVPLAARAAGFSAGELAGLMTAFVLGALAGQWPIGRLSDRLDRRSVLLAVVIGLALLCVVPPGQSLGAPGWQWAMAFLYGALAFSIYPLAVAHTLDRVGHGQALAAAAQMLFASSLGSVLGPVVASAAMGWLGPGALYSVNGLVLGGFALVMGVRMLRVEPAEQEAFLAVPRTTGIVNELDPRTDEAPEEPTGPGAATTGLPGPALALAETPRQARRG